MDETLAEMVKRLERELDTARRRMTTCKHEFSEPIPATRDIPDYIFSHYEGKGSDPEPIYDVTMKQESGWERSCALCGYTQYTAKTQPIITGHKPDFGDERRD